MLTNRSASEWSVPSTSTATAASTSLPYSSMTRPASAYLRFDVRVSTSKSEIRIG